MAKRGESIAAASHAELEKLRGERDEAIERCARLAADLLDLPKPPEYMGDGPHERVRYAGECIKTLREVGNVLGQAAKPEENAVHLRDLALRVVRDLEAAEAARHRLANDLTGVQARLTILLQDRGAPREGTCEYPGCNGPVPPGETICGRVHPAIGRRA